MKRKKVLIVASSLLLVIFMLLVFSQTYLVEESLRSSKMLFTNVVNKSMADVIDDMNKANLKKFLLMNDKSSWMKYREVETINNELKALRAKYPDLFQMYESNRMMKMLADPMILSGKDSAIIHVYNVLSNKRDSIRDTTFNLNSYADYLVKYTNKYNVLDISALDYKLLDTLVKVQLAKNDILVTPTIGVMDFSKKKFLYVNNTAYLGQLYTSDYVYEYAIGGLRNENVVYIVLYFPTAQYILKNNPYNFLALSILLVIIIAVVFIMLFKMIYNQEKLDKMKANFISNMNHELKTPISTISLACEMLQIPDTLKDAGATNTYVKIISNENKRLRGLVEVVLQQNKMTDAKFVFNKQDVDIHDIISKAQENTNFIVTNRKGDIKISLEAENPIIYADALHITNLVYNLLDNAIKYSPNELDINIKTYDDDKYLHIVVSDHGIGIEKSNLKHIFDKFYRVSTGEIHNIKGFGIGLSYVKQIVDLHKGSIDVKSKIGEGTTFDVKLPRN